MADAGVFESRRSGAVEAFVCRRLEDAGFLNAFSTRRGGVSRMPDGDLNLTFGPDDAANVEENRRRFLRGAGLPSWPLVTVKQTHSAIVHEEVEPYGPESEADALFSRQPALLLAVKTADCLPLLLGDPKTGLACAVHGGWRGIAGGIVGAAVSALKAAGSQPDDIIAAIGPCACGRCLEIGADVAHRFHDLHLDDAMSERNGRLTLDLPQAAEIQLQKAGVSPARVHVSGRCTIHEPELFFSHRRESPSGRPVGRLLSVIGRRPK